MVFPLSLSPSRCFSLVLACGLLTGASTLVAQYPGRSTPKEKPGPILRSIAVLEWTGEPLKPGAARLIPVTVFHDGEYEDGGLYLARPEPLALSNGTEYQLQESGLPQSVFDIYTASNMGGDWFGFGAWKPLASPAPVHALQPSKVDPEVVDGGDDRRPHFRKAPPDNGTAAGTTGATPPEDPERPTLRKRSSSAPDASAAANEGTAAAMGNHETATPGADPDRPRLTREAPKNEKQELPHLDGVPPDLEQMVAVSDATERPAHTFRYSWASPDDANKMQAQLQAVALDTIAKSMLTAKTSAKKAAATGPHSPASTTGKSASRTATTARRKTVPPSAAAALTDIRFNAFELTYSGAATLVLTARTAGDPAKAKYVTLIAQPDIYGTPQVQFSQVTNGDDLDASPRMRLVDAVDGEANSRGDLLFELRGNTTRQFVIYRVAGNRVDKMIATGPMPISPTSEP